MQITCPAVSSSGLGTLVELRSVSSCSITEVDSSWVISIPTTTMARRICVGWGCAVLSVGYRLAPESKFPGPVEDCFGALLWAREHAGTLGCDPERIAVAGDSAGGTLAAVVALRARDAGGPHFAARCCFIRQRTTIRRATHHMSRSNRLRSDSQRPEMVLDHYLQDARDVMNSDACPLRAETLAGLPPAFIAVAEYDVLRDEGEA